jgi:hypothetical protein
MEAADLVLGYRRLRNNVDYDIRLSNIVDGDKRLNNIDGDSDDDNGDVNDDDDGHLSLYPTIHPAIYLLHFIIIIIIIIIFNILVNKADGLLLESARHTVADYQAGMSFIRRKYQQWIPPVLSISAYKQINIDKVLQTITLFYTTLTNNNNYNNYNNNYNDNKDHDNHSKHDDKNIYYYTNEIERKRQRQWKHMLLTTFRRNLIF